MCDRVLIYDRCIAMQLQREPPPRPPPSATQRPPPPPPPSTDDQHQQRSRFLHFQYGSLHRKQAENRRRKEEAEGGKASQKGSEEAPKTTENEDNRNIRSGETQNGNSPIKGVTSPLSSNSSGTPTPTNGVSPLIVNSSAPGTNLSNFDPSSFNTYQEGYHLYQSWVATNAECVWDEELVRAVRATHFLGFIVGGFILVGGAPRVMAAICHAHARALLNAPPGWIIIVLGEVRECEVAVVQKGQFTPLGDALCWAIHRLTKKGAIADQSGIHKSLLTHFPAMAPPEPALIHAALSDLIRQRKVFHTSRGYGIVQADTYLTEVALTEVSHLKRNISPPRLLTTSEALTKAHGAAETETAGNVTHAAVQTDLADLLAGIWPTASILTPRPPAPPPDILQRSGSFRVDKQSISSIFIERERNTPRQNKYETYQTDNTSDIAIKGGEKGSVLSKILRVSQPRRRLASFSAQFPPPEWTDEKSESKHLHSVATQTRSSRHPGGPETCWMSFTHWAPRSSTLPRRPSKPFSTSPAPIDVHRHRPHSTSPSPIKLSYTKVHPYPQQLPNGHVPHQQISSSSPSPCITSSHSSRTTSPSLQSSTRTHHYDSRTHEHTSRSQSPYRGPYKHKSSSPANKSKRNQSSSPQPNSPLHFNQQSYQRSPMKKPPPTSSPHHTSPRDPKRKTLSVVAQNKTPIKDNTGIKRENRAANSPHQQYPQGSSPIRAKVRLNNPQKVSVATANDVDEGKTRIPEVTKTDDELNTRQQRFCSTRQDKKEDSTHEDGNNIKKQDRSGLQLDLSSEVHMNNFRKVVASPQKPEGLKNNVFHENLSSIAKGTVSDLTSKNMGYRDINKCDKRLYAEESQQNVPPEEDTEGEEVPVSESSDVQTSLEETEKPSIPVTEEKRKLKLSLPLSETSIHTEESLKKLEKKLHRKSLIALDNKKESLQKQKIILSPLDDLQSVKTYPSLSDLNLTFSSLAAQKILQGVSVNSIDTLVEVNMLAEKRKTSKEGVTNTDFGFV